MGPPRTTPFTCKSCPPSPLWNPYDRTLEATDYRLDMGRTYRMVSNPGIMEVCNNTFFGTELELEPQDYYTAPHLSNAVGKRRLTDSAHEQAGISFNLSNVELAPGQAITFSPNGNQFLSTYAKGAIPPRRR